ncbi:MAG TPA: cysteine desulfurase family protein [Bryobacteraceae bacterium]|nr:cysteine desulfurase family protein [Bryobacteraceae bacterium]
MQRFYFDHNATTPVSPEVLEAMLPVMTEVYGNASSIHHFGQAARKMLDAARQQVADLLGAEAQEIVFTSGGTEADNLAIFGAAAGGHVITTTFEHPAVLGAAAQLEHTLVPVDGRGLIDPDEVRAALRPNTKVISVMHANNEVGTIQPIHEIARIAAEAGVALHSDGVQAIGKIPVRVADLGVAMYSISGHKIGAPKGVGALYVRKGTSLKPMMFGGRHERERRAGTENVAGAVALGRAAEWIADHGDAENRRQAALRDRLEQSILERIPDTRVNGAGALRVPNTTNIRFDGIDSDALLIALDLRGFAVSSGAACSSGAPEPSHVLLAMGLSRLEARSSIRFSLGRSNTIEQVDALVEALVESVAHLRRLAPAYA